MKDRLIFLSLLITICIFSSCGHADTKADASDTRSKLNTDTVTVLPPPAPEQTVAKEKSTTRAAKPGIDRDAILRNIDQYLISKADIGNATLTVENKLKEATIIKAYAEVTVLDASDKALRSSFLIFENIGPGDTKAVRIPDVTGAVKVTSHIVRLKSDELTDGEPILVGSRYVPK